MNTKISDALAQFREWARGGISDAETAFLAGWQAALAAAGKQQVGKQQGPAAFVEHFTDRLTTLALTPLGLELGVGKHPLYAARQPGVKPWESC